MLNEWIICFPHLKIPILLDIYFEKQVYYPLTLITGPERQESGK